MAAYLGCAQDAIAGRVNSEVRSRLEIQDFRLLIAD
jgi:hypothetical protein